MMLVSFGFVLDKLVDHDERMSGPQDREIRDGSGARSGRVPWVLHPSGWGQVLFPCWSSGSGIQIEKAAGLG